MFIMELAQRTQTEINKICSRNPVETTLQQKSCGNYLDDLRKELQVMLQEELWQSEMFVWVTVLNMGFHNGKK